MQDLTCMFKVKPGISKAQPNWQLKNTLCLFVYLFVWTRMKKEWNTWGQSATCMFLTTSYIDAIGDLEDRLLPFTMNLSTHEVQNSDLLKEEKWWEVKWGG